MSVPFHRLPLVYFGPGRARTRVPLPSPGVPLLHPLPPCLAARFFLHGSLGLERRKSSASLLLLLLSSYPLSPRLLFPSAFPSSPSLTFLPTRFFHYSTPVRPFTPSLSLSLSLPPSASRPTVFLRSRQPSYLFSLRRNVIGISPPHSLPVNPFLLRMTSLLLFFFFFFSFLDDNYFFIFIFIRIDKYRIELRPKSNSIENLFSRFPKI